MARSVSSSGLARKVSRRHPHRLLVAGGEGAQGVLHPVAELAQHGVGQVERVLGDEVDPHPLGADQPHQLLDLVHQHLGRVVEEQVGLVEEEDQLRLRQVAHLGQLLEQLGEQPQQEHGVEHRGLHQPVGGQDVDHAPARRVGLHQVRRSRAGSPKKRLPALLLHHQQAALDGADAGRGDVAVRGAELRGVLGRRPGPWRAGPSGPAAAALRRRRPGRRG